MATTPTSLRHYAWVIVAAAFSMLMVSGGMIAALGVFVKPIAAELGASRRAVSLAYAIHMLSLGAASFAFGALADRTRIRRLALFGGTLRGSGPGVVHLSPFMREGYRRVREVAGAAGSSSTAVSSGRTSPVASRRTASSGAATTIR